MFSEHVDAQRAGGLVDIDVLTVALLAGDLAETERALDLEQKARQAAMLAVAGKLAAGLAHEVGTPLNIISGRAEFTLRSLPADDPRREDLESIVTQIDRISRVITGLLDVVRPQAPKLEPIAAADVVAELLPLLRHAARQRGIGLECTIAPDVLPVHGDTGQLQQVVLNLVVNALEATPYGRRVTIAQPLSLSHHGLASSSSPRALAKAEPWRGL